MKKNVQQRLCALLLACVMVLGLCPAALAADTENQIEHVIINQVYGGSTDGYASHSFIELYNPTGEAVDLSGWSIQYRSSADGDHSETWTKLDLTGNIAAEGFYLIRCGATTDTSNVTNSIPVGNQEWDIQLHNKGLSVALVNNQELLAETVKGDVSSNESIIDLAACAGNDHKPSKQERDDTQIPPAWEGEGFSEMNGLQSKKKAIRRDGFVDTDNSTADFVAVDYSVEVEEAMRPHVGECGEEETPTFAADSLTLQPGAETGSVNLNWYAPEGTTDACVKFGGETVAATVNELHTPTQMDESKYTDAGKLSCKATVSGLEAGTTYTYQVSNDGGATWSDVYTYTTPAEDSFTVTQNADGGAKAKGFENGKAALDVTQVGRYDSGMTNADGGVLEIVDYNDKTGWAYAVNGQSGVLTAIPLDAAKSKLAVDGKVDLLDGYDIDVKALVEDDTFAYGDMTSVAVSPDGETLAAAIQAEDYDADGRVALFTCNADGTLTFLRTVGTGIQPDMVTFTPAGGKILTANEGEPREGYGADDGDPAGSVTIVDVSTGTADTVGFNDFDGEDTRAGLVSKGIVLKKDTAPSADLEPEYIACTDDTAYVTCQEANAIAVLDLNSSAFTGIFSVGFEDYSKIPVDLGNGDDAYAPQTYENLKGIRMPDAISLYQVNGETYLLIANEGDSRAWSDEKGDNCNEYKNKTSLNGKSFEKKVTWFNANQYDGLEGGVDYLFGGRSFTVLRVTADGLEEVFDSGSDFEAKTAAYLPDYFNCSNDSLELEDRSGKKGPEPETITVGTVDGKAYAFVTLERIGGVMVYDITNPEKVSYVNYINSRDFSADVAADDSPEGLKFISASKSPTGNALLLAACEVGGTVAAYELTAGSPLPETDGLNIAVISDDHLYDADQLGSTGTAFERYLASDRKLLVESEAILDAALEKVAASGVKYLLIPGDLTKDGERINHELLAEKLAKLEADTDIEVFVINGNHDISNANAVRFDGDSTEKVETVNTDDFREIYKDFGYGQAVAKDADSLSYAVDLGTDYRLIVMDACIYNNDKADPSQETGGALSSDTLNWVLGQIKAAVQAGRRPIGMMHHGLVPHTAIQPAMFSEYLVKDYQTVATTLADAGMNLVFTGHFHSQDASSITTDKGNVLYDVETGSLVTSPCPIRYVTLGENSVSYTTEHVTEVVGYENFQQRAAGFLRTGMMGLVNAMLPNALRALGVTDEAQITALCQNEALKALLVGGFVAHYAGDETIDQATAAGLAQLAAISPELAQVAGSLYQDSAPADCKADGLRLSALPTYPSHSGSSGGSSGSGTYHVSVDKTVGGTVAISPKNAAKGDTVTITVNPDAGHVLKALTVVDTNGKTVAVTEKNGKYTFTMPTGKVTVKATFSEDVSKGTIFADVPANAYYADAVQWAAENGITGGTTATTFSPNASCTRAQAVTFLWRAAGSPAPQNRVNPFADLQSGTYYYDAVLWAVEHGITMGTSAATFDPNATCSRAQIVTFLWRAKGSPAANTPNPFTDAAKEAYYGNAMLWAVENGITTGTTSTTFSPSNNCTRAQIVTFLWRCMEK